MNLYVPISRYRFGDMQIEYVTEARSHTVGLLLYPASMADELVVHREFLSWKPQKFPDMVAQRLESLVQFKLLGDSLDGFGQGITMHNSDTLSSLRYSRQEEIQRDDETEIITYLNSARGYSCEHHLRYRQGDEALIFFTTIRNDGSEKFSLEMLSSFSLGAITPFASDDAPNRLHLHRFRSFWSAEGRHISQPVEELNLERSWSGHGIRAERFGQVGSLPVHGYHPFASIEDREAGVFWGATVAWAGSWQMELYRRDDQLSLSGGLADREFGHWFKNLAPGETFTSPQAYVTTVKGDFDELCQRLTAMQSQAVEQAPDSEQALPVLVNEFCTTWGNPTHENVCALAKRLKGSGAKYFVIDAGWYLGENGNWDLNQGEWTPSPQLFPDGIAATAKFIRAQGLVPGLWFEFEVVGSQSTLFHQAVDHFLKRDGMPVVAGQRRFWDFRDPWVRDYLREKVIHFLRDTGFGYIKVDYNETLGIGVDGAESLGEGLRQHILGVQDFFLEMRKEIPDLVIEVCASGGHRLEPSMLALASMASFSDAHESLEIPIIAANLHRLILPRQSQIWAVLHANDSHQRLIYSLASGFLGRLCLSGELDELDEKQWSLVQEVIRFYNRVAPIIKNGRSRLYQHIGSSWQHPQGAQAVLRTSTDNTEALLVIHTFAKPLPDGMIVDLPHGSWRIAGRLPGTTVDLKITGNKLGFQLAGEFEGYVIHLENNGELNTQ
ncbi:MAG: alpha-galactosidase [Chloroflexota bacterium]|nr:glycoside hydrolase family 36 protein [Anaerolineales bacterium]